MDEDPKTTSGVETDETERDEEFEYDENGDIIIPDVDFSDDDLDTDNDTDEETDDNDGDSDEESDAESDNDSQSGEGDEGNDQTPSAVDDKDAIIAELKKQVEELTKGGDTLSKQAKATLKALGVENTDDVIGALEQLAAESEGVSLKDYKEKKLEQLKNEEAQRALNRIEFEKKAQADLSEIKAAYPETAKYTHIDQIGNFKRFAQLRDLGVSAVEAYAAANIDAIKQDVARATKQQNLNDTKNHLKSNVPKNSADTSIKMSKEELATFRELFPDKSDKELQALYKQSL